MFLRRNRGRERPLAHQLDEWIAYLVGAAALLYILRCLPPLMAPQGALGVLLLFSSGALLGAVLLVVAAVIVFLVCTEPEAPKAAAKASGALKPVETHPGDPSLRDEERHQFYLSIIAEMTAAAEQPQRPPHSISCQGEYSGWIYTMPGSMYDRKQAIPNWPPPIDGPKAVARKWWATTRGGSLFLAQQPAKEEDLQVPIAEICLKGCSINIVTEGTRGKTRWWRKCPLHISHTDRVLMSDEKEFFLFAMGSAAKEQWFNVLRWACEGGGAAKVVEQLYDTYSANVRGASIMPYPQMDYTGEATVELRNADSGPLDGKGKKAWGWKSQWSLRKSPDKARTPRSKLNKGSAAHPDASPQAAMVSPEEVERLWMAAPALPAAATSSGKSQEGVRAPRSPVKEATPAADGRQAQPGGATGTSRNSKAGAQDAEGAALAPISTSPVKPPGLDWGDTPTSAQRAGSHDGGLSGQADRLQARTMPPRRYTMEDLSRLQSREGSSSGDLGTPLAGSSPRTNEPSGAVKGLEGGGVVFPSVAVEHAINMLLARLAFDLLRSPDFRAEVKARIQKKVNELRMPDYVHNLEVESIDLGHAVPAIRNLRGLPSPTAAIWPQAMFELEYDGNITVELKTRVEPRDGQAWAQFDKSLARWEGDSMDHTSTVRRSDSGSTTLVQTGVTSPVDSDGEASDSEGGAASNDVERSSKSEDAATNKGGKKKLGGRFMGMLPLRKRFVQGIRQLAESTADSISKMQLRMRLNVKSLKGTLVVWLPPPPGDRLWYSFITVPELEIEAKPLVAGRFLKYSAQAVRVSQWIASKAQSSMAKNLVFPSCNDFVIPGLLAVDHIAACATVPGFMEPHKGATTGRTSVDGANSEDEANGTPSASRGPSRPGSAGTKLGTMSTGDRKAGDGKLQQPGPGAASLPGQPAIPHGSLLRVSSSESDSAEAGTLFVAAAPAGEFDPLTGAPTAGAGLQAQGSDHGLRPELPSLSTAAGGSPGRGVLLYADDSPRRNLPPLDPFLEVSSPLSAAPAAGGLPAEGGLRAPVDFSAASLSSVSTSRPSGAVGTAGAMDSTAVGPPVGSTMAAESPTAHMPDASTLGVRDHRPLAPERGASRTASPPRRAFDSSILDRLAAALPDAKSLAHDAPFTASSAAHPAAAAQHTVTMPGDAPLSTSDHLVTSSAALPSSPASADPLSAASPAAADRIPADAGEAFAARDVPAGPDTSQAGAATPPRPRGVAKNAWSYPSPVGSPGFERQRTRSTGFEVSEGLLGAGSQPDVAQDSVAAGSSWQHSTARESAEFGSASAGSAAESSSGPDLALADLDDPHAHEMEGVPYDDAAAEGQMSPATSPTSRGASPDGAEDAALRNKAWFQQRKGLVGTALSKNWNAFKARNPHLDSQGKKLAAGLHTLRGQAEERVRKAIAAKEQQRKAGT
ncbi:hypothetical protein WJX72_004986 [[Myrmecia] bisecta]|uniref:SMP-LTD domain-containing protein n=1 Tax=[Myrmecia] bisecta TaxID=41462 RepID=A0AAW1QBE4_9CHLO